MSSITQEELENRIRDLTVLTVVSKDKEAVKGYEIQLEQAMNELKKRNNNER